MNKPVRNTTAHWKNLEQKHHLAPFTDYKSLGNEGGARIITKAEGVFLTDSEGERVLDGMAGLWCVNVGYGQHASWPTSPGGRCRSCRTTTPSSKPPTRRSPSSPRSWRRSRPRG